MKILVTLLFFFIYIVATKHSVFAVLLNGPPPASGKQFNTLLPGSPLPSGLDCSTRIRFTTWEARPTNTEENQYVPIKGSDYNIPPFNGTDQGVYLPGHADAANIFVNRVDGNFRGTTDEILQWAACKWGVDEDVVRAQAVVESYWDMATNGDNGESFGILQIRSIPGTLPAAYKSTAFNADYVYMRWRLCYEGLIDYLAEGNTGYAAGDPWGCLGTWYTGNWYGDGGGGALNYINTVKQRLNERTWETFTGVQVTPRPSIVQPSTSPMITQSNGGCGKKSQGDSDCDGNVTVLDFEIWRKELTGQLSTKNADYNNDTNVNVVDFEVWRKGFTQF